MNQKIILTVLYWSTLCFYTLAQTPGFNYQAVLRDSEGAPMPNADVTLYISLTDGPQGAVFYRESQTLTTNALGMLNTTVGNGTVETGQFADITGIQNLNMKLEANVPGEPDIVDFGFTKVSVTPYALYGEDADSDPDNEMQSLSLEGDSLKISEMGGVNISAFSSPWEQEELKLKYGAIDIYPDSVILGGASTARNQNGASTSLSCNRFQLKDPGTLTTEFSPIGIKVRGSRYVLSSTFTDEVSTFRLTKFIRQLPDTKDNTFERKDVEMDFVGHDLFVPNISNPFSGASFAVIGNNSQTTSRAAATFGGVYTTGNDNGPTTLMGYFPGTDPMNAFQIVFNGSNFGVVNTNNSEAAGTTTTYGANGNVNATMGTFAGAANHGMVAVYAEDGATPKAYMRSTGTASEVAADVLTMLATPPGRSGDPMTFAAPMGGEAAAYDRGTGQLVNGEATITCPEHFRWVADEASMTVTITPLSAESQGIAVIAKSAGGFKVKELHGGTGNYAFDYMVMCKRKAHKDFQVQRKAVKTIPDPSKAMLKQMPEGPMTSIRDFYKPESSKK